MSTPNAINFFSKGEHCSSVVEQNVAVTFSRRSARMHASNFDFLPKQFFYNSLSDAFQKRCKSRTSRKTPASTANADVFLFIRPGWRLLVCLLRPTEFSNVCQKCFIVSGQVYGHLQEAVRSLQLQKSLQQSVRANYGTKAELILDKQKKADLGAYCTTHQPEYDQSTKIFQNNIQ